MCDDLPDDLIELPDKKKTKKRNDNLIISSDSNNEVQKNIPEPIAKWMFGDSEKIPSRGNIQLVLFYCKLYNSCIKFTYAIVSLDIEKRFPEPKSYLHNVFVVVANETKIPQCLTSSTRSIDVKKKRLWSYTYEIKWPESKTFYATSHSKSTASTSAALKVLYWLHLNNRLDNRIPIVYQKNEARSVMNAPTEFTVDTKVLERINEFLNKYEDVSNFFQHL